MGWLSSYIIPVRHGLGQKKIRHKIKQKKKNGREL